MAKFFTQLSSAHQSFIETQKMFFVATAPVDGRINLSPKGMDTLRIKDPSTVLWLNLTGSGNETAAHVLENSRMTIMFCAFEGNPLILRLYGNAVFHQPGDEQWDELLALFPGYSGPRQIFELALESVQTSCGYAVPLYDFQGHRDRLEKWSRQKGEAGIRDYWNEKNTKSIDGKSTGMGNIR